MVDIPGVARRRKRRVEGGAADRKFPGRQFAQQDRASLPEQPGGGRVLGRNPSEARFRAAFGRDAGRVVDVLEPDRDAVQRAAIPAGQDLGLGSACRRERLVVQHPDIGVKRPVQSFDAGEIRSGQLDR